MPREIITLACGECQRRNYTQTKNRRTHPDRFEIRRFCRWCRKHTPHKETKWAASPGCEDSADLVLDRGWPVRVRAQVLPPAHCA